MIEMKIAITAPILILDCNEDFFFAVFATLTSMQLSKKNQDIRNSFREVLLNLGLKCK
jgi:hypothetical protein